MDDLLGLATDNPRAAARRAEELLSGSPEAAVASYAHQCLGIVRRDEGRMGPALRHLRLALRLAGGDRHRVADIRATYGATLVMGGRTRDGLEQLGLALADAEGELAGRVALRLGGTFAILGRHDEAEPIMAGAVRELEAAGNLVWLARAHAWQAHIRLSRGRLAGAEEAARAAESLYVELGAAYDRLPVIELRAEIAASRGDLAGSLRIWAEVFDEYRRLDLPPGVDSVLGLTATQLATGLGSDCLAELDAVAVTEHQPVERADLEQLRARAHLAVGSAGSAVAHARAASRLYRRHEQDWHALRADLTRVLAELAAGSTRRALAVEAARVAAALHAEHAAEAPVALVAAGQLAEGAERVARWREAASYARHPNGLVRAGAWRARALVGAEDGDRRQVLRAAAAGLDAIDEHRRLIGSSELRALATTHGRDLTTIALRHAATDPRTLLRWSERTRATALAQPPATSDAATIPASLAALRDNGRRLAEARAEGVPTDALERERLRLERAVRAESHTLSAATADQQKPPSVEEIVAAVGDGCLVELVDVDGTLHVLVAHTGRVRRKVTGSTEEVAALLGPTQMLLRRASRGRATDMSGLGGQLQEAILGDAARLVPDGPVVLAPTARLHGLAWPLLPVLGDRPFCVVPSAGQWLRARATPRPAAARRRTVLVSGPGLATGGAEVPLLAASHPDATLLAGKEATLEHVLDQLDGADLVHLAAHGNFRADSPLFSALDLADGPLTVHDLERVRRAPYRVVLSACESGVLAPVGAEELLGLAAALFSLGTAGLVSSVAEVNDTATADLMVDLHAALADGADPATALHRVRQQTAGDPVAAGTAAAFLALGA